MMRNKINYSFLFALLVLTVLTDSGAISASLVNITGSNGGLASPTDLLFLSGGTMSGNIAMGGNNISGGGTATFTTFSGAVTGHASLDCALAGCTYVGAVIGAGISNPFGTGTHEEGFGSGALAANTTGRRLQKACRARCRVMSPDRAICLLSFKV